MLPVFSYRNTTILLCGANVTALGVFQRSGRGLRCAHFALESHSAGPVGEADWLAHTTAGVRVLNAAREWSGPAILVLPAHLTLTKQIKVPCVGRAKRDQVIRFEAEQAIPHALSQVVWDYVPTSQRDHDQDFVLVAAKREVVEVLCAAVQAAGFEPARLLPFSLITLAGFQLARPAFPQPALILNLDGRSTTLLQVDGTRFAVRTLAQGGTTTAPQSNEVQAGTAIEAGRQAVADAVVSHGEEALQGFALRLSQEISRSVLHFGREGGMANPEHAFLTGEASRLAGLDTALAARLKIPVSHFDLRKVVEMSPGSTCDESRLGVLNDLSGAAALAVLPGHSPVDLLPPPLRRRASMRRRQPWLMAAALLAVVAPVPAIIHYRQVATVARAKVAALGKALAPLRAREERIRANLELLKQYKIQIAQLQSVHDRRTTWLHLFSELQEQLIRVEDVWFEQVRPIPPAEGRPLKLTVSGHMLDRSNPAAPDRAETNRRVKELLAGLARMPQVISVEGERFDHSQPGLLRFDFTLISDPSHPL